MATQEIIVEFVVDYSGLDQAIDTLEKLGQLDAKVAQEYRRTTTEINKQSQAIKNTANAYKGPIQSIEQLDKKTKQFVKDFVDGFQEGITEELKRAKPEIDAFRKKLEDAGKGGAAATQSLKQELRQLTEQIAKVKATGGPIDPAMLQRAGQLKDAIADANLEIKNAGSDTRGIDNVVGSLSALAGGFSAVQGAVGLFTDDNEELQKVLLRVNSAMALATGIQQVANATQREGSLAKLADTVVTKTQIATQQLYTLITGKSTAATKAFKIALATTGIGLLVVGVLALVNALSSMSDEAEKAADAEALLSAELDKQNRILSDNVSAIEFRTKIAIANAKKRGASEGDINNEVLKGLIKTDLEYKRVLRSREALLNNFYSADGRRLDLVVKNAQTAGDALDQINVKLAHTIDDNQRKSLEGTKGFLTNLLQAYKDAGNTTNAINEQIADNQANSAEKAREKAIENFKKAQEREREIRAAGFADFKAGVELQLLTTEKGSDEELAIRKKLLNAELLISLENEKLTLNQRKLLIQQFFKDSIALEKALSSERQKASIEDISSRLNAELQSINLSNEKKLELTEAAINAAAELEILSAENNAAKIQEINAKRDRAILEARKTSIQAAADFEAGLSQATGGAAQRALQRVVDDERLKLDVRINAVDQLEEIEQASINKRLQTNQKLFDEGAINEQEFVLAEEQLLDERNKVWENSEDKRALLTKQSNEKIRQDIIETAQRTVEIFSEVVGILSGVFQNLAAAENNQIEDQKRKLQELRDAGAITERDALVRAKRIEAEERRIKNQQAQRDKQIAVFNALLAIPQAYLQGLKSAPPPLGPILGAINAAIAGAQAALVIARPVPKFATGKKNNYEGPGWIGEAGAELMQTADGSLHIATKPTLVYLGSKDKVFTSFETKSMIPHVDKAAIRAEKTLPIDYEKLASAIIKGLPPPAPEKTVNVEINKDFVAESMVEAMSRVNYWDKYYTMKH